MADQADGSIIIDTEINSDGFKAGSAELLAAIKALSTEVKNLGQTLKELFSKPLTPEINTGGAEDKVAALEAKSTGTANLPRRITEYQRQRHACAGNSYTAGEHRWCDGKRHPVCSVRSTP